MLADTEGFNGLAGFVKDAANFPVIYVGGIKRLEQVEEILAECCADLVALCREEETVPEGILRRYDSQH